MSKILATFSGGFGDILWSLPTVRQLSKHNRCKIDFLMMPKYASLIPMISSQSYIDKCFVDEEWVCVGSPHGDQPWIPPQKYVGMYEQVVNLTYQRHPTAYESLIDFIAAPHLLYLDEPICPFIEVPIDAEGTLDNVVATAFNDMYANEKQYFMECLIAHTAGSGIEYRDTSKLEWQSAAFVIKHAIAFVGCRSSNYVLANAVAQKNIFTFEPHPNRNATGHFGRTFGNPHWHEVSGTLGSPIKNEASRAAHLINIWKKEKQNAILATESR